MCLNCARAWAEYQGKLPRGPLPVGRSTGHLEAPGVVSAVLELETKIRTAEGLLRTQQDLRKLAPNLQSALDESRMTDPIRFLIPAFRINSMPALLKLASCFPSVPPRRTCGLARIWKTSASRVSTSRDRGDRGGPGRAPSLLPRYNRSARLLLKEARLEASPPRSPTTPFTGKACTSAR